MKFKGSRVDEVLWEMARRRCLLKSEVVAVGCMRA